MAVGDVLHQRADQVVGDRVHHDFFAHQGWSLAAEHVQAERGFEVAETQLDGPAAEIKLAQRLGAVGRRVQQRRDQHQFLRPKPRHGPADLDQAHRHRCGQLRPLFRSPERALPLTFLPGHQPVTPAQSLARPPVEFAKMMHPHHGIHAARQQRGQARIRTETPIRQHHVAFFESGQQLLQQAAVMFLERAFDPLKQRAAGQTKARHQFDHGKAAARFLSGRLRPGLLIGGGVGHGNARAVHLP